MPIDFPSNPTLNQIFSTNTKSWIYGTSGWKAYDIQGTVANTAVRQITATNGQTSFTVPNYVQGQNQIRVFINGVRQNNVVDFAETTPTTITLTSGAVAGDNVAFEVITYAGTPVFTGVYPSIIDDTVTNATRFPLFAQGTGGSLSIVNTDSTGLTFNPLTATLTVGSLTFGDATTQTTSANTTPVNTFAQAAFNSANAGVTLATAAYAQANTVPTNINTRGIQTNASYFPTFVDANNATNATETVHTHDNYSFNPSTGVLSATSFSGAGTGLTGTASGFTANSTTFWAGLPLPTAGAVPGASNIPRTDTNGYLFLNYIHSNTASAENPTVGNVIVTNNSDNAYFRKSTPANLYGGSWSSWYAGQVAHDQLGSYAYLGYGAASTTAITAGTNQAGSGLRFWGSAGAVNATQVSTQAVGATPSGTWKPVGTVTQTTSLVKHTIWVRVA
jgi:hypothetical protein